MYTKSVQDIPQKELFGFFFDFQENSGVSNSLRLVIRPLTGHKTANFPAPHRFPGRRGGSDPPLHLPPSATPPRPRRSPSLCAAWRGLARPCWGHAGRRRRRRRGSPPAWGGSPPPACGRPCPPPSRLIGPCFGPSKV